MSISGKCKLCARNGITNNYKIWVESFPEDKREDIKINVTREHEHSHSALDSDEEDVEESASYQDQAQSAHDFAASYQAAASQHPTSSKRRRLDDEQSDEEYDKDAEYSEDEVENSEKLARKKYKYAKNVRIEGQDRVEVAAAIKNQFKSQPKAYRDDQVLKQKKEIDEGKRTVIEVPSEEVLRHIMSEVKHKYQKPTEWLQNVLRSAYSQAARFMPGETIIKGFVQLLTVFPFFMMFCMVYQQMMCVKLTPYADRILHIDATGGLIKIQEAAFSRLYTYCMVMKHKQYLGEETGYVPIGEFTTSKHDTWAITTCLYFFKFHLDKLIGKGRAQFRVIVLDYSWPSIHAVVLTFNKQTITEYADHIYKIAKGEIDFDESRSYMVSCVSHTMHRFSDSVKLLKLDKDTKTHTRTMICLTFSLLLNSTDLETITQHFHHICIIYLSQYENALLAESLAYVNRFLSERPESEKSHKEVVSEYCNLESDEPSAQTQKVDLTLKAQSPFTQGFEDEADSATESLKNEPTNKSNNDPNSPPNNNKLYCPQIIALLLNMFMPLCYIWASFALKGYGVTRMSNGLVEMYNGYRKGGTTDVESPSNYIDDVVTKVEAHAFRYQQKILVPPKATNKPEPDQTEAPEVPPFELVPDQHCELHVVDTYWKPHEGISKPSYQDKVPLHKLEALATKKSEPKRPGCVLCKLATVSAGHNKTKKHIEAASKANESAEETEEEAIEEATQKTTSKFRQIIKAKLPPFCDTCNVPVTNWSQHRASQKHGRNETAAQEKANNKKPELIDLDTEAKTAPIDGNEPKKTDNATEKNDDVCKYFVHGYGIMYSSLKRLVNQEFLDSDVLEAFLKIEAKSYRGDVYVASSFYATKLILGQNLTEMFSKESFGEAKIIVSVIHHKARKHWYGLYINTVDKRFLLFDPMKSDWADDSLGESDYAVDGNVQPYLDDNSYDSFLHNQDIFLKNGFRNWKLSLRPFDAPYCRNGWTCLKTSYPEQTDGINCGVYVVLTLAQMMGGTCEELVRFKHGAADLIQYRTQIHTTLDRNAIYDYEQRNNF